MFEMVPTLWPRGRAPVPAFCSEEERLAVLHAYDLPGMQDDEELAAITAFAASLCRAPIALVSIVEPDCQRFIARTGLDAITAPRSASFCAQAMLMSKTMVVPDALSTGFLADDPLVKGEPHIRFYAGAPLVSTEGAPVGTLCVIDTDPRPKGLSEFQREGLEVLAQAVKRRLLQRRQEIAALRAIARRETRVHRVIDSVPGIAWSAAPDGTFDYFNARWRETTGAEPPVLAEDWAKFAHPEDFPDALNQWKDAVKRGVAFEAAWRLRIHDGSWRWILSHAEPVVEEDGGTRWFGTLTDIDAGRREFEKRELLASELSHRIKNIFAVLSSLVAIRSRDHTAAEPLAQELNAIIRSLSRAHDYVQPTDGRKSDSLPDLLGDLLAPYTAGKGDRVTISGDTVAIGPTAATPLALIFHELATNAAKYGALASAQGTVSIETRIAPDSPETLHVHWRERGGAASAAKPDELVKEGFGSRLLRTAVEGQLGGRFDRRVTEEGLEIDLELPVERVTA